MHKKEEKYKYNSFYRLTFCCKHASIRAKIIQSTEAIYNFGSVNIITLSYVLLNRLLRLSRYFVCSALYEAVSMV